MSLPIDISPNELKKQTKQIFDAVKLSECATAVCYPGCGHEYLTNAILGRPAMLKSILGKYYKKHLFIPVLLTPSDNAKKVLTRMIDVIMSRHIKLPNITTFRQIVTYLVHIGYQPYIFLYKAHRVPPRQLSSILSMIHDVLIETNTVGAQIYFEANIYADPWLSILQKHHKFLSNIETLPVLPKNETEYFINSIGKLYGVHISDNIKTKLLSAFGGNLWLNTEAVRYLRRHQNASIEEIIRSPLLTIKIKTVYDLLTSVEQRELANIVVNKSSATKPEILQYFTATGLIRKKEGSYVLTVPVFLPYLKQTLSAARLSTDNTGSIVLDGTPIDQVCTPSEKTILQLLISHQGKIIHRDQIAEILWGGNSEKYSDWAIDKTISRLRKTLKKLGLPASTIATKKKQGFILI